MVGCVSEGRAHSFLKLYICALFLSTSPFFPLISGIKVSVHFSVDGILCRAPLSEVLPVLCSACIVGPLQARGRVILLPSVPSKNMDPFAAVCSSGRPTDRAGML